MLRGIVDTPPSPPPPPTPPHPEEEAKFTTSPTLSWLQSMECISPRHQARLTWNDGSCKMNRCRLTHSTGRAFTQRQVNSTARRRSHPKTPSPHQHHPTPTPPPPPDSPDQFTDCVAFGNCYSLCTYWDILTKKPHRKIVYAQMGSSQWEATNDAFHTWKKSFVQSQAANDYFSLQWQRMINAYNRHKAKPRSFVLGYFTTRE